MSSGVKRDYRSDLRAAQALETRRVIVTTASELFAARGYGATTVDAVAEAAGVSRKTVFTAVGGKLDLLKTALDWAVTGDDRQLALADRNDLRELLEQSDPEKLITGWVHVLVDIDIRVGPLMRALEIAANGDTEAQDLLDESQRRRLAGARTIVRRLAALGALKPDLNHNQGVDIAWLASDPMLHDRLVRTRGWSRGRFEQWLAEFLLEQLIGESVD
ncbi:TetR/AcrR family transcriptional regulator [Mycolicibacterium tusciae]|uniref:TetR family transcriptional regulator n=1 Tax=Mycolicibacterium tusciae TaxID=75922 RepID=A0A1X0JH16_9MYCO|nr:TetR/AcrR family transcriptional regulator [Mycolicibacterium tusciae]ORB62064.1 TetR family transcriptional regulator [Mycolicibacterium tusciae]